MKKVVIVGGGFGGVTVAQKLLPLAQEKIIELVIVSASKNFLFTPLLHEAGAGKLRFETVAPNLTDIFPEYVTIINDKVITVDPETKTFWLESDSRRSDSNTYDYLVLAAGASTNFWDTLGAKENASEFKTLEDAVKLRQKIENGLKSVIVVGGGPAGIECAIEISEAIKAEGNEPEVTVVEATPKILSMYSERIQKYVKKVLAKKGIELLLETPVQEIKSDECLMKNGQKVCADMTLWTAGVKANSISTNNSLVVDKFGRYIVEPTLQVKDYPNVFVIGDQSAGNPQLAQVAVSQAKVVAKNIFALLAEKPLKKFVFKSKGTLLSLGKGRAAGNIFGISITGRIAWFIWHFVYIMKVINWNMRSALLKDWLFGMKDEKLSNLQK